jgi:hypothetical protein
MQGFILLPVGEFAFLPACLAEESMTSLRICRYPGSGSINSGCSAMANASNAESQPYPVRDV